MMNDEKRDRKLRETFEQCLSGIDTLPSQRAEISRKLSEAPADTGRINYRAIAIPAVLTLLLCVGIWGFSGLQGSQSYPDPLKTDTTLVAEKPMPTDFVPLARPEGGEGGTDIVIEGESVTWDERGTIVPAGESGSLEAAIRVVSFINRWQAHCWEDLLEMCSQEWRDRQADPAAALAGLTAFMTPDALDNYVYNPDALHIKTIVSSEGARLPGYVMYFTLTDKEHPEARYVVPFVVKKENGGLWYIHPDKLKDYTALSPQFLPEAAEEIPEEEQLRQALDQADPVLAASLVPVGISCESSGARLEIISAAVSEEHIMVVYSLEDLEGGRILGDPNLYKAIFLTEDFAYDSPPNLSTYLVYQHIDPETHRIISAERLAFPRPLSLTEIRPKITLSLGPLNTIHRLQFDAIRLLREYGGRSQELVTLPNEIYGESINLPSEPKFFKDFEIRQMGIKILDPAESLEIPLNDYVVLSGIDLDESGILHLQLHYPKIDSFTVPGIRSSFNIIQEEDFIQSERPSYLMWHEHSPAHLYCVEMQLKLNGEIRDDASLIIEADSLSPAVSGDWLVEIPTEQIWVSTAGSAEAAEAPAAEPEEAAGPGSV